MGLPAAAFQFLGSEAVGQYEPWAPLKIARTGHHKPEQHRSHRNRQDLSSQKALL